MKKTSIFSAVGTFAFTAVALGLCVFNVSSHQSRNANDNLKLVNIKAAQASTSEWKCDGSDHLNCSYTTAANVLIVGTGILTYTSN